jgi:hypothetical protein
LLLVILMIVKEASYLSLEWRRLLQIPDCTSAVEELASSSRTMSVSAIYDIGEAIGSTLDRIKFATDAPTWGRALALYESGKVTNFKSDEVGYSAIVHGGHQYHVFVSTHHFDEGSCDCYLGQNDALCKHMVAVALYAIKGGVPLNDKEKQLLSAPVCSGKLGELTKKEAKAIAAGMSGAMRHVQPYNGPSRIWFAYQGPPLCPRGNYRRGESSSPSETWPSG